MTDAPRERPPAHERTRDRNKILAGLGVVLASIGSIVVIGGGEDPQRAADRFQCSQYVDPPNTIVVDGRNIDCWDIWDEFNEPGPTFPPTTTTAPAPTTTQPGATTTTTQPGATTTTPPTTTTVPEGPVSIIQSNFNINNNLQAAWHWDNDGYPAFRIHCSFSHLDYIDPILAPGNNQFMHLHMFFGNMTVTSNSNYTSLRQTGDGTCQGGPLNRTAYWVPAIFDGNDNVVIPNRGSAGTAGFELYYKGETALNHSQGLSAVQEYPAGLRIISGALGASGSGTWSWKCGGGASTQHFPTNCNPGDHLRGTIRFPYCWNGTDLWLPNSAHLTYGAHTWGTCENVPSHPIHLPELTLFVDYTVQPGWDVSQWYLSSDRMSTNPANWLPGGSTFHADWLMAWDPVVLTEWVEHCIHLGRASSQGVLCSGRQMIPYPKPYEGPWTISGWTPMHPSFYQ